MPWRLMKRSVSSCWYSGLFLMPAQALRRRAVAGQLEDAAEQDRHVVELRARCAARSPG